MTTELLDVDRTIELLKELCDPRGHDLLDAIGEALNETLVALDRIGETASVDGHRLLVDNENHSRRVGLRSVS